MNIKNIKIGDKFKVNIKLASQFSQSDSYSIPYDHDLNENSILVVKGFKMNTFTGETVPALSMLKKHTPFPIENWGINLRYLIPVEKGHPITNIFK